MWGNARQFYTNKLEILQKEAIKAITFSDYNTPTHPLFKELDILSFNDLFNYKVSSLMWDHNTLPVSISSRFTRRRNEHTYITRMATSYNVTIKHFKTN